MRFDQIVWTCLDGLNGKLSLWTCWNLSILMSKNFTCALSTRYIEDNEIHKREANSNPQPQPTRFWLLTLWCVELVDFISSTCQRASIQLATWMLQNQQRFFEFKLQTFSADFRTTKHSDLGTKIKLLILIVAIQRSLVNIIWKISNMISAANTQHILNWQHPAPPTGCMKV